MAPRRSALELYRDALLLLAIEGRPLKKTPFMYGLGMSWRPLDMMVEDMEDKKLIEKLYPEDFSWQERRKLGFDTRTRYLVQITMKGQYVLRWLDELLRYIQDESPSIRPPLWVLQSLFRHRIEDLRVGGPDPFTAMQRPLEVALPGLTFKLMPPSEKASRDLPARVIIAQYRIIEEGSRDLGAEFRVRPYLGPRVFPIPFEWKAHNAYQDLAAKFNTMQREQPLFCPECGHKCKNFRGLKVHVGNKHWRKKREILETAKIMLKMRQS